jgi:peptidoglycan/xylan/chitin deacetylase (PgdA/CDA1 family)
MPGRRPGHQEPQRKQTVAELSIYKTAACNKCNKAANRFFKPHLAGWRDGPSDPRAAPARHLVRSLREHIIRAGFATLAATGLHRLVQPLVGGVGAIFMLHHVRPARDGTFQPNRLLEITPEFLRATLSYLAAEGVEIVTLDELRRRILARDFARRFACLTFDDGYRDNRDVALPVLREFGAPATVYVASDFAAGRGRLWWVALERLIAGNDRITVAIDDSEQRFDTSTLDGKRAAFARLNGWVVAQADDRAATRAIGEWCARHDLAADTIGSELCMTWDELRAFAADPLITIGAHTITHCNLAKQDEATARTEMVESRERIAAALGREVRHFAYPYGYRSAAGPREFALAATLGFATAVTTRPGMVFAEHANHPTALPRISLNGQYQNPRFLPALASGAATALWNGFRRLDVD